MKKNLISKLIDVKKILQEENIIIFGLSGLPSTRSEIWRFAPFFEVITLNRTGEFDSIAKNVSVRFFSKEKNRALIVKKPAKLATNKTVQDYIKKTAGNKKVGIYIYKPSLELELACKKMGWTMIANPYSILKNVSSKKTFFDILTKINFDRNYTILKFSQFENTLEDLFSKFGKKIVVQLLLDEGGGRSTFFFNIKDKKRIRKIIEERLILINSTSKIEDLEVVVSPFFKGPAISIMGCVTRQNGTLSSYAQHQLIDIPEVLGKKNDGQGVFCGHDWSASDNISQKTHNQAQLLTEKIGLELKKMGHLGIFGLDFILDEKNENIIPLEINTRLLGTFPASVYVQYQKKEVPLVAFHVLDFMNIPYKISSPKTYRQGRKRDGAHIVLFNLFGYDIICNNALVGGVYKLKNKKIEFLRLGSELSDLKNNDEFILTEGVPTKEKVYKKNRKLLKILTRKTITKDNCKKLNNFGREIIKQVYKNLNILPYEKK